jgi:hypothetical protein
MSMWANTMSTSNPPAAAVPGTHGEFGGAPVAAGAPAGLPDAETLTQLANALFAALPGRPAVPGTAADIQAAPPLTPAGDIGSQPVAAYVPPTSGFAPPSEAELRSAPASLSSLGGVASPATAANPSGDPAYYFLEPEGAALPGAAVGIAPSSAARLESGALPTAPSPPAAFAQPAEPGFGPLPGLAEGSVVLAPVGGAPASVPFAFRPELVPDASSTPIGGGATSPTPLPQASLPQESGALPAAADVPPPAASAPSAETGPRGSLGGPGLPPLGGVPSASSFYFLDEAGPQPFAPAAPAFNVKGFGLDGFEGGLSGVETGAYPLDSPLAGAEPPAQPAGVERAPTGGAPAAVPGHDAVSHPLRVDTPPPSGLTGLGQG